MKALRALPSPEPPLRFLRNSEFEEQTSYSGPVHRHHKTQSILTASQCQHRGEHRSKSQSLQLKMASPSKKSFLHTSHAMSSKSAESLWNGCPLGQCIGGGSPTTALAVGASPNSGGRRKVRPLCVWRGCCATFSRLRAERSAPAESGSMGARGAAAASSLDRRPPLRARRCPDGESA